MGVRGVLPVRRGVADSARVVSASAEVFVFQRELSFRDCRFLLRLAATPERRGLKKKKKSREYVSCKELRRELQPEMR